MGLFLAEEFLDGIKKMADFFRGSRFCFLVTVEIIYSQYQMRDFLGQSPVKINAGQFIGHFIDNDISIVDIGRGVSIKLPVFLEKIKTRFF